MAAAEAVLATNQEAAAAAVPWWARYTRWRAVSKAEADAAERRLLDLTRAELEVQDVPVGPRPQEYMHTIQGGPKGPPDVVCLAGYGAGAAFYFRALGGMSQVLRTHAVDLLGTGMSGRPRFTARNREQAEDFFLRSLDSWRAAAGLDRFVLVGHSLGGYLAARYALQYPHRVQHLVLVCPAGVAAQPAGYQDPEVVRSPWTLRGQAYRAFKGAWDLGLTPGSVVRALGPWGPGLISKYARNRFREGMGLSDEEVGAFEAYFYQIMAARGSGEHALRHLLAPFAWARSPLEPDLAQLKVPVTFIYGEYDWMDPKAAQRVCRQLAQTRGPLNPADLRISIIPDAGHYPMIDQPGLFVQALLSQTSACHAVSPAQVAAAVRMAGPGHHGADAAARGANQDAAAAASALGAGAAAADLAASSAERVQSGEAAQPSSGAGADRHHGSSAGSSPAASRGSSPSAGGARGFVAQGVLGNSGHARRTIRTWAALPAQALAGSDSASSLAEGGAGGPKAVRGEQEEVVTDLDPDGATIGGRGARRYGLR